MRAVSCGASPREVGYRSRQTSCDFPFCVSFRLPLTHEDAGQLQEQGLKCVALINPIWDTWPLLKRASFFTLAGPLNHRHILFAALEIKDRNLTF